MRQLHIGMVGMVKVLVFDWDAKTNEGNHIHQRGKSSNRITVPAPSFPSFHNEDQQLSCLAGQEVFKKRFDEALGAMV